MTFATFSFFPAAFAAPPEKPALAPAGTLEHSRARFHQACILTISKKYPEALAALRHLGPIPPASEKTLAKEVTQLQLYLAFLTGEAPLPIHPVFAPWRGIEAFGTLPEQRRAADLALALRRNSTAAHLYPGLAEAAKKKGDAELQAWAALQLARLNYLSPKPDYPDAIKELGRFRTTLRRAACAPYALLQCALLENNTADDTLAAAKTFRTLIEDHPASPEAEDAAYYLAMLFYFEKDHQKAVTALQAFTETHPKSAKNANILKTLIPRIREEHLSSLQKEKAAIEAAKKAAEKKNAAAESASPF